MSDAFDNPHKLRQEIGELWPRLKLAEARLADLEAERALTVARAENAERALEESDVLLRALRGETIDSWDAEMIWLLRIDAHLSRKEGQT